MATIIVLRAASLVPLFALAVSALGFVDPETDFAFIEFEAYPNFQSNPPAQSSQSQFWRLAGQIAFPAGKIGGHQLFGTFKSTVINRDIMYDNTRLNDGALRRFWLSGGGVVMETPKQSGVVVVGLGVNSDFADLGLMDFNTEWIYIHSFRVNSTFNWGVGLDLQQYFHKYEPYPLIFVDWKLSDKTKLKWDADFLELHQFVSSRFCLTAGVRFNLEFFALKQNADYEYNSMGLETGLQYALGSDFYLRLKYKELVWGQETMGLPNGIHHTQRIGTGRSLRLNVVYGI